MGSSPILRSVVESLQSLDFTGFGDFSYAEKGVKVPVTSIVFFWPVISILFPVSFAPYIIADAYAFVIRKRRVLGDDGIFTGHIR